MTHSVAGAPPVVAFFHGGGWVVCDLDSHDGMCRAICNASGCVVVAVDYRLAPEHRSLPAWRTRTRSSSWLGEHADELGGDPARLAVCGDSAGGNLAAVVALMARDRGGPALGLQVLVYPVIDFRFDTPSHLDPGDARGAPERRGPLLLVRVPQRGSRRCRPVRVRRSAPSHSACCRPRWSSSPSSTRCVTKARRTRSGSRSDGVPVTIERYDGMFHSFVTFLGALPQARAAVAQIGDALRAAFATPA